MTDITVRLANRISNNLHSSIEVEALEEIRQLRARDAKPHGCVCPAGAESGCRGPGCPRQALVVT